MLTHAMTRPLAKSWVHTYREPRDLTEMSGLNARHALVAKARDDARKERERLRAERQGR